MEWIISTAIALVVVFVIFCFKIEQDNYEYWFRDFSVMQKIARVTVYSLLAGVCIGVFVLLVWCIKGLIF